MKQIIAAMICLAIMTAVPLGAIAQSSEPSPGVEDPGYNYTDPYWYYWPVIGGFEYSNGVANGTYVDFYLNETTGTITDYTAKLVDYNYYYPMVYDSGNVEGSNGQGYGYGDVPQPTEYVVKFFDSIEFQGFVSNGRPATFGQSLVFLGDNVMMSFGDYEWSSISFQYGEANSTTVFTVPDGFEISKVPYYYELYDIPEEEAIGIGWAVEGSGSAPSYDYDDSMGSEYSPWYWSYDQAFMRNGNITCSIWVDMGTIDIQGNTITVSTYAGAYLGTSSWIEYAWQYQHTEPPFIGDAPEEDKGAISGAIESGLMGAVGYLVAGESGVQYSDSRALNDPTFKMEFMNVEKNSFQVQVESEIKNGRIVTVVLNKNALAAETVKDIRVLFNDEKARPCNSMQELVNMDGGSEAGYYMISGNSQNTIFVYVPHFSVHVITVSLAESLIGTVLAPAIVASACIAAAVGLAIRRGKRNKEDI